MVLLDGGQYSSLRLKTIIADDRQVVIHHQRHHHRGMGLLRVLHAS